MTPRLATLWSRLVRLYQKDIWQSSVLDDRSLRGRTFAVLRVVSITLTGLNTTRAMIRAAALSFSTLLGLGPLIGLAVLIAGFAMGENDSKVVTNQLQNLIKYIAPQIARYEETDAARRATATNGEAKPNGDATAVAPPGQSSAKTQEKEEAKAATIEVNQQLVDFIETMIAGTRSSSAGGAIAVISLIVVVLLLFTSVEESFNDIWGVRRGRSWLTRLVFYWTILSLGAVLFFGAVGALSAATYISYFQEHLQNRLPYGSELAKALTVSLPIFAVILVVVLLTLFYRYIPNTHVFWRAAFSGAVVTASMLVLNNLLTASYFRRVDLTSSLYGSLALPMVLMFGLYVFWLLVIVGGQISYAVQNVHFRNSQVAWASLTASTRERLTLVVLLTIGRRFQACLPPCTLSQLGSTIKVPTQILNESLTRLIDLGFVSPVPPGPDGDSSDYLYQPARPLNRITLGEFKHAFENYGDDPAGETIDRLDPLVGRYHQALRTLEHQDVFAKTLEELFASHAFEESLPPFMFGKPTKTATVR
jgi:membrane protein